MEYTGTHAYNVCEDSHFRTALVPAYRMARITNGIHGGAGNDSTARGPGCRMICPSRSTAGRRRSTRTAAWRRRRARSGSGASCATSAWQGSALAARGAGGRIKGPQQSLASVQRNTVHNYILREMLCGPPSHLEPADPRYMNARRYANLRSPPLSIRGTEKIWDTTLSSAGRLAQRGRGGPHSPLGG
jgi:hypothetical protein